MKNSRYIRHLVSLPSVFFGIGVGALLLPLAAPSVAQPSGRRIRRGKYVTIPVGAYKWVQGKGGYTSDSHIVKRYPAPGGAENLELIYATRTYVTNKLNTLSPEWKSGLRNPFGSDKGGPTQPLIVAPGWWFAQIVGNDQESYGTHLADFKVTHIVSGKRVTRYFCAAFDVVLTHVPIFEEAGRRAQFGPYVKLMRNSGIVAWHRWAGETTSTSENEMHCIDPASPFIKISLNKQIDSFIDMGTGGAYPPEPTSGDFAITEAQIDAVRRRRVNKLFVPGAVEDNKNP